MKRILILVPVLFFNISCSTVSDLRIISQKAGPWQTNCYLVYDSLSREAAIIDAGQTVDSLLTCIAENNLKLKYIFITHCHQDHISGVPGLLRQFPDAKLCYSKQEYEDLENYSHWQELYAPEYVKAWSSDSAAKALMNFDYSSLKAPDIFIEENQKYKLGDAVIRAYKIPGHSRGSVCYSVNKMLFTGDLIYYNSVGYLEYKFGSKDEITKSVRKLYKLFPDETVIYAGHGPVSNIGFEKKSNKAVSQDGVH